ncbi:aconitase X [Paraburkholderia heleia]|uniref:aconitase X n=1 Tax=Paraburkholderia heleia TaxID=634127 RepID=UPI0005A75A45|nr:aconitase X catalytic domain-containing protein [Paraburkholderia heleia]
MRLNDDERAMLDGRDGEAVHAAMDLLVRYGEALGAERLVDTNNVSGTVGATMPFLRDYALKESGMDSVFSEFSLDTPGKIDIPKVKVFSTHLQQGLDPENAHLQGIDEQVVKVYKMGEEYKAKLGIQPMNTCAPYLTGNVPVRGEHCAWMESSAVIYINAVLGARTNAEGRESTGAAMLTGKIPYWGLHLEENRAGTHLIELDIEIKTVQDWGLLGYYIGEAVQDQIPVIDGLRGGANLAKLKHFGAAAASSGGVEMYHIVGQTPEARTREEALRGRKPVEVIRYGVAERRLAYERVNTTARELKVDFVMLGCPHYSIEQIWEVCELLEGRKVNANSSLWIFTARATRQLADQAGYTERLKNAGAVLMTDTCSAIGRVMPKGTRVVALDSAKQAHYLPAIMGVEAWFGTTAECVDAAVTRKWQGWLTT